MKYNYILLAAAAVVQANPVALPQGVTAKISPSASAPSACKPSYSGTFGIVVQTLGSNARQSVSGMADGQPNASTKASSAAVSQISDGQPQASTARASSAPVSQISDGQPQASMGKASSAPVSQLSDGQPQAPTTMATRVPVSQIGDGQPQAAMSTMMKTMPAVTQIADGQVQAMYRPVSQISDGQPQAPKPTATPINQLSDGQPQQATSGASAKSSGAPVTQLSDGQPQATTKASAVSQLSDGQPQATRSGSSAASMATQMVACKAAGVLNLTLADGVLLDSQGRTGYIASNYQFQFDKPAQAGAIYTSGFSVCANGSLALGGSNIFYQCLSGNFYNLYDRHWAPQCSPVTIDVLMLKNCS